jgi:beta-lactamase class A
MGKVSRLCSVLTLGLALNCPKPLLAQDSSDETQESPARVQVEQLIQQTHSEVAVAFRSLDGSQELFIRADEAFPAAPATIQVPVMIELYREAQANELQLTDTVIVHNGFHSLVDDSPYRLDPKTDPDQDLYKSIGKPVTLRDLCEHMVANNSSLAASLLIERLGIAQVRQRIDALHANGVELFRGIEPGKPSDPKPQNETSARGILELLWTLAKGQEADDDASKEMVGIIARAALKRPPTAGLPSDPRAAESVQLTGIGQQAMIVLGPHPFVVVILTRGITNPETSAELMAQITHALAAAIT